ncbi:MAG: hypothetical protein O3A95_09355 [Planctomycetota bacterium]|nr:hypothetical protein [Planctomycetota bacterium]MDA1114488.1 hypothetical protein [Planctomycetota bacterium]
MLAPAFDVFREFLYAICDLVLALPRHAIALTQRKKRLALFEELKQAELDFLPPSLPAPVTPLKKIMLSCGDASGENHAVRLLEVLHARHENLTVSGFGGACLEQMGMEVWKPLADLNVMGFKDVAAQLPMFFASVYRFAKEIRIHRPEVVVLIDYPGLNRHLLRIAKRAGIPVVDYIAPQLWAWAPWRVRNFRLADTLLTILPFEQDWYARHGATAKFVGHPLADSLAAATDTWQPPEEGEWIAILPGSRRREIRENLSLMLAAAEELQAKRPSVRFVLPHLRAPVWPLLHEMLEDSKVCVTPAPDHFHAVLRQCSGAWVVSGTASLEVAALQIPSVVVFHMPSRFGAWLAGHTISVPYVGAANLIARSCIVPERIGHGLDPSDLCADLLRQLDEPGRSESLAALEQLQSDALAPGTAQRAALAVEKTLHSA